MLGQFNATQEGSGMNMTTHGAVPTEKCSIPSGTPVPWLVFLKNSPLVSVRVERDEKAQTWIQAREIGAPKLGVLVEEVDATRVGED
jgi:hypothetical protein